MKPWSARIALVALGEAGCAGFLQMGDGYLGVEGYVYELANPPPASHGILVLDPSRLPSGTEPSRVAGCAITLEPWAPGKKPRGETLRGEHS